MIAQIVYYNWLYSFYHFDGKYSRKKLKKKLKIKEIMQICIARHGKV